MYIYAAYIYIHQVTWEGERGERRERGRERRREGDRKRWREGGGREGTREEERRQRGSRERETEGGHPVVLLHRDLYEECCSKPASCYTCPVYTVEAGPLLVQEVNLHSVTAIGNTVKETTHCNTYNTCIYSTCYIDMYSLLLSVFLCLTGERHLCTYI